MEAEILAEEACVAVLAGPDPPPPRLGPCKTAWRPALRVEPVPGAWRLLLEALDSGADAVALTSPRAVRALAPGARLLAPRLSRVTVAAVGPATAGLARRLLGVEPLVPREYTGLELGRLLAGLGVGRVAWPRGSVAGPGLPEALSRAGVELVDFVAYRVLGDHEGAREAAAEASRSAALVVTSGLVASLVLPRLAPPGPRLTVILGPTTLSRARPLLEEAGLEYCVASPHTLEGAALCLEAAQGLGSV